MQESVIVELHDPFASSQSYLGELNIEVGFVGKRTSEEPYDQDLLADAFIQVRYGKKIDRVAR